MGINKLEGTPWHIERFHRKEYDDRRNENGLTDKQQELENQYIKIIELKNQKVKNKVISEILGINENSLKYYIKQLRKNNRL